MKTRKTILLSGASGLVGSALTDFLKAANFRVLRLVRRGPKSPEEILWRVDRGLETPSKIEGISAAIHLSGKNIACRWSAKRKKTLRNSRIQSTRTLLETLNQLSEPPEVFLCASAIGFYGYDREGELYENSPPGDGFLAELCKDWEREAVKTEGFRSVSLRFGVILSPRGGALKSMLLPFQLCLGGRLGSGNQYMSWISLPDALRATLHCLETPSIEGPVNITAPHCPTNLEFTETLAKALNRPSIFPLPTWVIRLLFGQMGKETLLSSLRVRPKKLEETSFSFLHPNLKKALEELL